GTSLIYRACFRIRLLRDSVITYNGSLSASWQTVCTLLDAQKTGKGTRRMFHRIFATDDSVATTILRIVLGIVFFAHGAQKMLGWFGGPGFSTTMNAFTQVMHVPTALA